MEKNIEKYKLMKHRCLWILFLYLLTACTSRNKQLEAALQFAGDNRAQLEKVLERYKDDSLKYRAAVFLIEALPYHYGYGGIWLDNYIAQYDKLFNEQKYTQWQLHDSLEKRCGRFDVGKLEIKSDVFIDAELLIENIEWAFKVRNEQPWGKKISFEDFCEYILPYRVANEKLSSWREEIYNRYNPMLDSIRGLPEAEDPLVAARLLVDSLAKGGFAYIDNFPHGPFAGIKLLDWRAGTCLETSIIQQYVFRALGLPCVMDKMLMKGDNNAAHFWTSMRGLDGKKYYNCLLDCNAIDSVSAYRVPKGKVYRTTFRINQDIMTAMGKTAEEVHPTFRYPLLLDVTTEYVGKNAQTIKIAPTDIYGEIEKGDIVYLCASSRMSWIPVAWGKYSKEGACLVDVEGGTVFRLATYSEGQLTLRSNPFLVDKDMQKVHFYPSNRKREEVYLFGKFNTLFEGELTRMLGGVFEGSNELDFAKRDTLFMVMERPRRLYNVVSPKKDKAYRYVRYRGGKKSYCNISEISFYAHPGDTVPLKGRMIGTPGDFENKGTRDFSTVFDGNPYTSFLYSKPEGGWVGLDLGKKQLIGKIIFCPANRDNFIHQGETYELFYCEKDCWKSAGRSVANSDSLLYTVPEGALFLLKNHTHGNEERIFEYKNGKQIYW